MPPSLAQHLRLLSILPSNMSPLARNFSSSAAAAPVALRHSASLVLLNPHNQVLLIHRPRHSTAFANAHVFPGGVVTDADFHPHPPTNPPTPTALAISAIRETFEETGLLLSTTPPPKSVSLPEARKKIHAGELTFQAFLDSWNGKADTRTLRKFTKWVTPQHLTRRFSSQLFLGYTPSSTLPSDDGGIEVVAATFLHPWTALDAARKGEIIFFPPQFYLLTRMADIFVSGPGGDLMEKEEERRKLWALAEKGFGELVIEPEIVKKLGRGRVVMGLNGGERKGDLEKVVVVGVPQGGGEPRGVELKGVGDVAKL